MDNHLDGERLKIGERVRWNRNATVTGYHTSENGVRSYFVMPDDKEPHDPDEEAFPGDLQRLVVDGPLAQLGEPSGESRALIDLDTVEKDLVWARNEVQGVSSAVATALTRTVDVLCLYQMPGDRDDDGALADLRWLATYANLIRGMYHGVDQVQSRSSKVSEPRASYSDPYHYGLWVVRVASAVKAFKDLADVARLHVESVPDSLRNQHGLIPNFLLPDEDIPF